jgi:hypothetical protein
MAKVEDTTFKAVGDSDERLHGHPAIMVAGHPAAEQVTVKALLTALGMTEVALVVVTTDTLDVSLATLSQRADGTGLGEEAHVPRAAIMSGLTERQLHAVMKGYGTSGLARPIWASVTPTNSSWPVKAMLVELLKEREALREAMQRKADETSTD